jgi:soluble lytic murein transglycosylase-like protein
LLVSYDNYVPIPVKEDHAGLALQWEQEQKAPLPPRRNVPARYRELFDEASRNSGVPLEILESIAWAESQFKPWAKSPVRADGYRDLGIFQINTRYQEWFEKAYNRGRPFDPMNPYEAVPIVARHIRYLWKHYGHWPDVVIAYNRGTRARTLSDKSWEYLISVYTP